MFGTMATSTAPPVGAHLVKRAVVAAQAEVEVVWEVALGQVTFV